jgi:hypothetical protein
MHVFRLVERIMERTRPLRPVREGGILRFDIAPLPARDIVLRDGSVVRHGERCVILHFDNRMLAARSANEPSVRVLTWRLARMGGQDLEALARRIRQGDIPPGIRVIWAETVFYEALVRFGFTIRPAAPGLRAPFARLFMLAMLATYGRPRHLSQDGRTIDHLRLGEAWLLIDDLLDRFPVPLSDAQAPAACRDRSVSPRSIAAAAS